MPTIQDAFQCDHPVALITGSGARRVGREIATHLAKLGCHIALHAHTSLTQAEEVAATIRETTGSQVVITAGSLRDPEVPEQLVQQTWEHFGRIDVLVNSAAIWRPTRLEDVTAEELRRYLDINTLAPFLSARAAGIKMAGQRAGGSIINIGDWATVRPYLDHAAYFPSKGALEAMTRSLAVELSQRNAAIRVNCIQPGPVLLADDVSEREAERIASCTLVGRIGNPSHIAHAVEFLSTNDFVTGICLPVDGGRSVYAPDGLQVGLNTG